MWREKYNSGCGFHSHTIVHVAQESATNNVIPIYKNTCACYDLHIYDSSTKFVIANMSRPTRCQYFQVTEFSIWLKLTIQATTSRQLTITRPDGTRKIIVAGKGNLALLYEANPVVGQWIVCVNTGRDLSRFPCK